MGITRRPVRPGTGKYTGSITGKAVLRTVSEVVEIEIRRTMMERGKEAPVAATKNGRIAVEREREAPEAAMRIGRSAVERALEAPAAATAISLTTVVGKQKIPDADIRDLAAPIRDVNRIEEGLLEGRRHITGVEGMKIQMARDIVHSRRAGRRRQGSKGLL